MPAKKIRVCCGMTCSVMGAGAIMRKIEAETGLKAGEKNEENDVNYCACTGYCHMAPSVAVDGNMIHEGKEETIMAEIEKAAANGPQESSITDATVDEIMTNDFLGDL